MRIWVLLFGMCGGCTVQMVGDQTRLDDLTTRMGRVEQMVNQHTEIFNAQTAQIRRAQAKPAPTPVP